MMYQSWTFVEIGKSRSQTWAGKGWRQDSYIQAWCRVHRHPTLLTIPNILTFSFLNFSDCTPHLHLMQPMLIFGIWWAVAFTAGSLQAFNSATKLMRQVANEGVRSIRSS